MSLALAQLRRTPLRTVLLIVVVGILIFLVQFLATLSSTLQSFNTGALAHLNADVLIYSADAQASLDASRVPTGLANQASHVVGVAGATEIGVADFTVTGPDGRYEFALIGAGPGDAAQPRVPVSGRLPGDGELLADTTDASVGVSVGRIVTLEPGGAVLRVVGTATAIRYDGLVTGWTTFDSWRAAVLAQNPAGTVLANAVAVQAKPGVAVSALAARLAAALPGTQVLTRSQAVADVPGASVIAATFELLIAVAFIATVFVVGSVFLLITVQRSSVWVMVRALGGSAGLLSVAVLTQAALVVLGACAVATAGLAVAATVSSATFPLSVAPGLVSVTVVASLVGACLSSLMPMRRIGRIDPVVAVA
jgi:putative ABC transport system permease protein